MWLINADTERLESFIGQDLPKYMILSHTWGQDEVSFEDLKNGSHITKKAYPKIRETCRLAREHALQYVWIDTCCIDKSSSAELSEAINSMFIWYQRSSICVAYLQDFPSSGSLDTQLRGCHWFTRGWTLQELLAPRVVLFYDQRWGKIGTKSGLAGRLAEITKIHLKAICGEQPLSGFSVAQRMCWAACRETTRLEDMAYCLLGVFGINMPLLYGEGKQAFKRLQEEIIKKIPDYSVLAWTNRIVPEPRNRQSRIFSAVLADSASQFSSCGTLTVLSTSSNRVNEVSVNSHGIKVRARLRLKPLQKKKGKRNLSSETSAYFYVLPVCYRGATCFGIRLRKLGPNQFVRENLRKLEILDRSSIWDTTTDEIYLLAQSLAPIAGYTAGILTNHMIVQTFRSQVLQLQLDNILEVNNAYPTSRYDDEDLVFFLPQVEDRGCDAIAATLTGNLPPTDATRHMRLTFTCFFFAFGWDSASDQASEGPQCTIVSYRQYDMPLNFITSELVHQDQNSLEVMDNIVHYKIPRCSAVVIRFPKSGINLIVSFVLEKVRDPDISPNEFWRVKFNCEEVAEDQIPQIQPCPWALNLLGVETEESFDIGE